MCIIADYHLHTDHSGDSKAPMETQILTGIEKGLKIMCFTDHYDPDFPYENIPDVSPGTFELSYAPYREEYLEMRDRYKDRISHTDYDFVIGSNHLCGGTDPYYPDFLKTRTQEEALALYLEDTLLNIRAFPGIDSCGHLDYVARYLPERERFYTYSAFAELIDPILSELINRGIALEVNTAPLTKGMRYFNPLPDILSRYREMGGELITIGSDAHVPERIAGCYLVITPFTGKESP